MSFFCLSEFLDPLFNSKINKIYGLWSFKNLMSTRLLGLVAKG